MFGFSFSELLTVFIICLVLFKPRDIIKTIQTFSLYYEKLKYEFENIKSQVFLLEENKFIEEEVIDEFTIDNNKNSKNKTRKAKLKSKK